MRPDLVHTISPSSGEAENVTDEIFTKAIQIVIKRDDGLTVDFDVQLLDKKRSDMYEGFCSRLKNAKTSGSRVVGVNSFRAYPKSQLEKQKTKQPPAKAGGLDLSTKVGIRVARPVYVSVLKLSSPLGSK